MKNITYDNCKRVYELYKQVEFWANRNEFRNAVLEFEKVAEYLWDIDQDFSQKLYDFYHQMLDAYYYKVHKLDEFKKKILGFKVQIYYFTLCKYYSYVERLTKDSNIAVKMCENKDINAYDKALSLEYDMSKVDITLSNNFINKVKYLKSYNYMEFDKLSALIQESVGAAYKKEFLKLEESFK